jgi:hypothetical protein
MCTDFVLEESFRKSAPLPQRTSPRGSTRGRPQIFVLLKSNHLRIQSVYTGILSSLLHVSAVERRLQRATRKAY